MRINDILSRTIAEDTSTISIRWTPSHLDDPKRVAQRTAAILNGTAAEATILGNTMADKLADEGRLLHLSLGPEVRE